MNKITFYPFQGHMTLIIICVPFLIFSILALFNLKLDFQSNLILLSIINIIPLITILQILSNKVITIDNESISFWFFFTKKYYFSDIKSVEVDYRIIVKLYNGKEINVLAHVFNNSARMRRIFAEIQDCIEKKKKIIITLDEKIKHNNLNLHSHNKLVTISKPHILNYLAVIFGLIMVIVTLVLNPHPTIGIFEQLMFYSLYPFFGFVVLYTGLENMFYPTYNQDFIVLRNIVFIPWEKIIPISEVVSVKVYEYTEKDKGYFYIIIETKSLEHYRLDINLSYKKNIEKFLDFCRSKEIEVIGKI